MNNPAAGIALIKQFEQCCLNAYKPLSSDPWTIGWGHTGADVGSTTVWTQAQADAIFVTDIQHFISGVAAVLTRAINDNQFGALLSFAYNLGIGALRSSHLLRLLNASEFDVAAGEFLKWDNAGGKPCAGLLRRRQAEQALFLQS